MRASERPAKAAGEFVLGGWQETPCPSMERHVSGCWQMARLAADQHPLAVRGLWQDGELQAMGGVVEVAKGDGLAFAWIREGLPIMVWRKIIPHMALGLASCHWRGVRRVSAIVVATHETGLRLVKRLGFTFRGIETGFAGASEPMLRYVHCWPAFEQSALVDWQLAELERACFETWCPALVEAHRDP